MIIIKVIVLKILIVLVVLCVFVGIVNVVIIGNIDVFYGGYVKLDVMWSDYFVGVLVGGSIGCDFYVLSIIFVGVDSDSDVVFDMYVC